MDIDQLVEALGRDPRFQPALQAAATELSDVSPQQLDELIKLIRTALQRPDLYDEIRSAAIQDDMVEPDDLPEQFDPQALLAVLVVLQRLRDSNQSGESAELAMRRGGLARMRTLASRGRLGDTMLAHISPEEAALLKARGGAGTINPDTGLPQFFSLKKLFKAILPIALNFIVPGLGAAIGGALGATGVAATMLGQAVIGGLSAGLTGGNVLQGALLGGLGGGLGGSVGGGISDALGLGLGATGQSVLGGALLGGVAGAATGQGFGKGALMGAAGAGLSAATQGLGSGQLGAAIGAAGQSAGNMLTAGYRPKEALAGGAFAGLVTGLMPQQSQQPGREGGLRRPSDMAGEGLRVPQGVPGEFTQQGTTNYLTGEQGTIPGTPPQMVGPETAVPGVEPGTAGSGLQLSGRDLYTPPGAQPGSGLPSLGLKEIGLLASAASALSKPPEVQQAVAGLSPQQQEYFNRPSVKWDWSRMQADANARNMSLSQFMASYWPQITSGAYNLPGGSEAPATPPGGQSAPATPPGMATGGLNSVARLVRGGGTGRDDAISARLSDGEYVMDAETVAMLGDGSTSAGARRLDEFRANIRKHKGRQMARGKFSPNAKSPLSYLRGV